MENHHKSYHFIGIGGCGMAPLAKILNACSHRVTGSDMKPSETTRSLAEDGIKIKFEHHPENITPGSVVVVSSAIKENNCELLHAISCGQTILHRSDILKNIINNRKSVTISGTHGKTTTCAMLTHLLDSTTRNVLGIVGGKMYNTQKPTFLDDSTLVIAEADESDGTFLKYAPSISILTNLELDHLDFYKSKKNLLDVFSQHLENIDKQGTLVYNYDCPNLRKLSQKFTGNKISFGFNPKSDIYAKNINYKNHKLFFNVQLKEKSFFCELSTLGKHNVSNALAAIAAAYTLKQDLSHICAQLKSFKGVARRLDLILDTPEIKIYNDYAHNPGKIKATIQALRQAYKEYTLHVFFEAHRYSRLETMYKDFILSFSFAHLVTVTPIYSAGEKNTNNFCIEKFAKDLRELCHIKAEAVYNNNGAIVSALKHKKEKTIILTLGAGDITTLAYQIKEKMLC